MLLTVAGVRKNFGIDIILENASFTVDRHEKAALVGRNGTGKTTLLKIITGEMEPDAGSVTIARGARIGLLRQENSVGLARTLLEEAEAGIAEKVALKDRLHELEQVLESGRATEEDLDEYAALHEHLEEAGGWALDNDIVTVLKQMGFEEKEFSRPTTSLSGGEKTRLALARLLLQEPDLLILDEPTNHLDLQATEWLEGWIRGYKGAVLIVSHDRVFLENTVGRVIELRQRTTHPYPGSFREFVKLRQAEDARLAEVAAQQQAQIAKLDEFVRRFMNSQRTAQARGRLKLMNRLISEKVEAPVKDRGMAAGFGDVQRSGEIVAQVEGLTFGYPGLTLGRGLDWTVRIGERWGVIGENGAGKSTLVKTMLGEIEPLAGKTRIGARVMLGLFSQDAVDLDPEDSPLEHIMRECALEGPVARNLLGRFLIEGDDVFRPIGTLSGGEKNKLVLAELTQLSPNLLVLDEPTNHLDMASRDALIQVLQEFKGTLILISHDRQLLAAATTQTLDVRKTKVVQFPGGYTEYRLSLTKPAAPAKKAAPPPASVQGMGIQWRGQPKPAEPALAPRELSKEIARMEKEAAKLEDDVSAAEEALRAVEAQLAEGSGDAVALSHRHGELQAEVAGRLKQWEQAHERLDELKALRG